MKREAGSRVRTVVARLLAACAVAIAICVPASALAGSGETRTPPPLAAGAEVAADETGALAGPQSRHWMVRVQGRPSALVAVDAEERGASEAAAGQTAVGQADRIETAQDRVSATIERRGLADEELFRVGTVFNGIAITTDPSEAERIENIEGVVSVEPLPLDQRHNAFSVDAVGAPAVWAPAGGGFTGDGIRIGVIDTGIDYTHTTFGGRGNGLDLTSARSPLFNPSDPDGNPGDFTVEVTGTQIYPSQKVVGGFDFAGDDYDARSDASSTPAPDPNPMDCPSSGGTGRGHGTHVAATAAGFGTTLNGSTYTGGYSSHTPSGFRVGPGVAPEADLFALRVFGCDGTTALTTLAIDWAVDPNRDGNPADRLDVINLSLGSSFGLPESAPARAATAASEAGTIVVASSGNSGNQIYQTGSPGSSPRAISVANMVSGTHRDALDIVDYPGPMGYNGRYPANYSTNFNWASAAPVTAALYYPAPGNRSGCSPFNLSDSNGMTGKIVVLDWRSVRDDPSSASACPSAVRADNAQAAGAVGVVMADSANGFPVSISGNATLPAAYTSAPLSTTLWAVAQFDPGTKVRFDPSLMGTIIDTSSLTPTGTVRDSSSRGPGAAGALKPDVAAPGTDIRSASSGSGAGSLSLNGTSMAAPHVAGLMALLRQRHPGWSVEELKALAMNTASPNLFTGNGQTGSIHSPQRVGTGTVNAPAAVAGRTIAYGVNSDGVGDGRVGVNLGALEVPPGQPFQRDFFIKVVGKGTPVINPFSASFVERSTVPGATWSFPDGAIFALNATGEHLLRVRLRVNDPSALRNSREVTIASDNNREWIAEASGLVRITDAATAVTTVPVYASLAPTSSLGATVDEVRFGAASGSGSIAFQGSSVSTGGASTFGGGTINDFNSMRTPLELQHTSPPLSPAPGSPSSAGGDLEHVGASYEPTWNELTFGFSLRDNLPALAGFGVAEVVVDADRDGADDFTISVERVSISGSGPTDSFRTIVRDTTPQREVVNMDYPPFVTYFNFAGRAFDTDVFTMTLLPSWIGLGPTNSKFDYRVRTFSPFVSGIRDETPKLTYDYLNEGITFGGESIQDDRPDSLGFSWNVANMDANGTTGALILHHMNPSGERDEVIPMALERAPELSVQAPGTLQEGQSAPVAASATDANGDPLSFAWDLDDGKGFAVTAAQAVLTAEDGPSTRALRARVSDGRTPPVIADRVVTVENVPPAVTASVIGSPPSGVRATATDPSPADVAAGFAWSFDVGADGTVERQLTGPATVDVPLSTPPGRSAIRITATDKDGGTSAPVTIQADSPACRVPRLRGVKLAQARKRLASAGCRLGKVKRPGKGNRARQVVRSQSVKPGRLMPPGTPVSVVLRNR